MLPSPKIIIIDDVIEHLDGLATALNSKGYACLKILFNEPSTNLGSCPHVRVIFADLHLNDGASGTRDEIHFAIIGGILETSIKPCGPYILVLWTQFPDKAAGLQAFLDTRLTNVSKPYAVLSLDKAVHLNPKGLVKSPTKLIQNITAIVNGNSQTAALLNWEERISGAASDTVSAVVELASSASKTGNELGRLLGHLAHGAAGTHLEDDRFSSVNEALLPILADQASALKIKEADKKIWRKAFTKADTTGLSATESAKLNRLMHIAKAQPGSRGNERGAVVELPNKYVSGFLKTFGMEQDAAAKTQFQCKSLGKTGVRWILVQAQAACDFAQSQPGPLPFYLGLEVPESFSEKDGSLPGATWESPLFEFDGASRVLRVNTRFPVPLTLSTAARCTQIYRIREQLLNDMLYKFHGYIARPGIISFFGPKKKKK